MFTVRTLENLIEIMVINGERLRHLSIDVDISGDWLRAVFIDGKMTKTLTVDHHDLYQIFKGAYGENELILKFKSKGVQAFAFTFGG
jgi:hypothetical protein